MTCGIYLHYQARCDGCRINPCHICIRLRSFSADADGIGFASNTFIADVDIVIAGREIGTSEIAQCDVARPRCVHVQRAPTRGRVGLADGVATQRAPTRGRVGAARCVAQERHPSGGRVGFARCVATQRIKTGGRVVEALCVGVECPLAGGRISFAGCVAEER